MAQGSTVGEQRTGTALGSRKRAFRKLQTRLQMLSGALIFWYILGFTAIQGLLYVVIVPPWQHYDEPTHFEYAWLIAHTNRLPEFGDGDQVMRREVLNTLFAGDFFRSMAAPDLLTDDDEVWLGISELGHPPLYYALVSFPLRLVTHLDVVSQLYVARSVSLCLFVLTIAVAYGAMRDLFVRPHPLVWAVPLAIALLPTFADSMTSVNNDVGAAFVTSLLLWGCVRLVRFGVRWTTTLWIIVATVAALLTKNTTIIGVPIALASFVIAVSLHHIHLRFRTLAVAGGLVSLLALLILVTWGDAAAWYRWSSGEGQANNTQIQVEASPVGTHALVLESSPESPLRQLINPLFPDQLGLSSQPVTIGGWVWADEAGAVAKLGLRYSAWGQIGDVEATVPLTVTREPTFVAWQFTPPQRLRSLSYVLFVEPPQTATASRVYLDGAFLVPGSFPITIEPQFGTNEAASGTWGGRAFTNLLRNGSGEQSWPRLQPWIERTVYAYIHRSPAQVFTALIDVPRVGWRILTQILPVAFDSFAGWFGWGDVRLNHPAWVLFTRLFGLSVICSAVYWLVQQRRMNDRTLYWTLLLLGCASVLVWLNVLLRPLPLLGAGDATPIARYTFPAIIATGLMLVGAFWVAVPRTYRPAALTILLASLVVLDIAALYTIASA